jgi:predicted house-cleaning NTP pyrophosphatase (Maf/HAM1 superfamily)
MITILNYYNFQREALPQDADELEDKEDEQPVVVVLKPGDLTAEEVANIKKEGKAVLTCQICVVV